MDKQQLKVRLGKGRVKAIDLNGETVYIRSSKYGRITELQELEKTDPIEAARLLIQEALCDEQGNLVFDDDSFCLDDIDTSTLNVLAEAVAKHNGQKPDEVKKN